MFNSNGVRACRELVEISQQRQISQTEKFRTKNTFNVWKHIDRCVRIHFLRWSKSNFKTEMEWQTKQWAMFSDLYH